MRYTPQSSVVLVTTTSRTSCWHSSKHVHLSAETFGAMRSRWGGFSTDLMVTIRLAHRVPPRQKRAGERLLFYSRYHTEGGSEVIILSHDVNDMPCPVEACFGLYLPPPVVLSANVRDYGAPSRGSRTERLEKISCIGYRRGREPLDIRCWNEYAQAVHVNEKTYGK